MVTIQLWWASMLSGYASDDFPHSSGFATSRRLTPIPIGGFVAPAVADVYME